MRLVCPNCSAQYEIDGSMIPEDGRDVQCSNCGHTWFELPAPSAAPEMSDPDTPLEAVEQDQPFDGGDYDDDGADEFEDSADDEDVEAHGHRPDNLSREVFEDESDEGTATAPEQDTDEAEDVSDTEFDAAANVTEDDTAEADVWTEPDEVDDDQGQDDVPTTGAISQRRPADAAALDILREEAERELSQRRAPPSESLETQTDLGLEAIRDRRTPSRALRARMAHLGEELPEEDSVPEPRADKKSRLLSPTQAEEAVAYEEPRRDLLPDIEEINSTLKTAPIGAGSPEAKARSGFRAGFLIVLFVVGAGIFSYAQAPAIARALPNTESAMITYVDQVNSFRDWIDGLIGRGAN